MARRKDREEPESTYEASEPAPAEEDKAPLEDTPPLEASPLEDVSQKEASERVEEIYQRIVAMLTRLDEQKNTPESRISFLDRLAMKLFGLTPAEAYPRWDAPLFTLTWQERVARAVKQWRNSANDFVWSTLGSLWDVLPPTLRPATVERLLPHYRWCISSGSDEIFLSGTAHSVEKATEEAQSVVAILKGVFEVLRRRPAGISPPAFNHVVYFENGTKVIPEINPSDQNPYTWEVTSHPRIVHQGQL